LNQATFRIFQRFGIAVPFLAALVALPRSPLRRLAHPQAAAGRLRGEPCDRPMRKDRQKMKLVAFGTFALLLAGCSSSGGGTGTSPANPTTVPSGGAVDLGAGADFSSSKQPESGGLACGSATCAPTQVCCVSVADGGVATGEACAAPGSCTGGYPIQCRGPEQCGGNPCCLNINTGAPTGISCTSAATECKPALDVFTRTGKTRLCHVDADCTAGAQGTILNACCTGKQGGLTQQFCFSKTLADLSMGAVTCP
jgi:hypothetical protein